jgi:hypothetical protein
MAATSTVFIAGNSVKTNVFQVPANVYEHNIAVSVTSTKTALTATATIGSSHATSKTAFHCLSSNQDKDTTTAIVPPNGSNSLFYIPNAHPHSASILNLFGNTAHTENGFALFVAHGTESSGSYSFDLTKSKPFKTCTDNTSCAELVCVTGSEEMITALDAAYEPFVKENGHPAFVTIDKTHAVVTLSNLSRLVSLSTVLSATSSHSTIVVSIHNVEKEGAVATISIDYNAKDPNYKHEGNSLITLLHDHIVSKNTFSFTHEHVADISPGKQSDDDEDSIVTFTGDISLTTITPPKTSELSTNGAAVPAHPIIAKIKNSQLGTYLSEREKSFTAVAHMCGSYFDHLVSTIKSI